MFTTSQFFFKEDEGRALAGEFTEEKSGVRAIRSAMKRAYDSILSDILKPEVPNVDILRGAALILHDMEIILEEQIRCELLRRKTGEAPVDRRFEI
jgi:hypothetical protein